MDNIVTLTSDNGTDTRIKETNKYIETTNAWKARNKDKLAMYARNYYNKRTSNDPEYKAILCEKKKAQKLKKKLENNVETAKTGRPRKYPSKYPIVPIQSN